MIGAVRHLRRGQYLSMPWRNGAGVTLQIAREPALGDDFRWRLSLATVASSGPFSNYAGYRRSVTLIDGEGFRLAIGDREPLLLETVGASVLFSGDDAASYALLGAVSRDLSLMVREPGAIISVIRVQSAAPVVVPLQPGALKAAFCLASTTLCADTEITLAVHDTALMGPHTAALSLRPASDLPADLLLLSWSLAANPLDSDASLPLR